MSAPDGYVKLPDQRRCKCLRVWRDVGGAYWCCGKPENAAPLKPHDPPWLREPPAEEGPA